MGWQTRLSLGRDLMSLIEKRRRDKANRRSEIMQMMLYGGNVAKNVAKDRKEWSIVEDYAKSHGFEWNKKEKKFVKLHKNIPLRHEKFLDNEGFEHEHVIEEENTFIVLNRDQMSYMQKQEEYGLTTLDEFVYSKDADEKIDKSNVRDFVKVVETQNLPSTKPEERIKFEPSGMEPQGTPGGYQNLYFMDKDNQYPSSNIKDYKTNKKTNKVNTVDPNEIRIGEINSRLKEINAFMSSPGPQGHQTYLNSPLDSSGKYVNEEVQEYYEESIRLQQELKSLQDTSFVAPNNEEAIAALGRFGDSEIREVDIGGQQMPIHVRPDEAQAIDDGYQDEVLASATITENPYTGLGEAWSGQYQGGNVYSQQPGRGGNLGQSFMGAYNMTKGASGWLGKMNPTLGVLGVGMMVWDWFSGAADQAAANKAQIKAMGDQIENIEQADESLREQMAITQDRGAEAFSNIEEQSKVSTSALVEQSGDLYANVSDTLDKIEKGGKGLDTGKSEAVKIAASEEIRSDVDLQATKMHTQKEQAITQTRYGLDDAWRKQQDELADMEFAIEQLNDQIAYLEESDEWYENLI